MAHRPGLAHHHNCSLKACTTFGSVDSQRFEFDGPITSTQHGRDAAGGELVENGQILGEAQRMVQRRQQGGNRDSDARRGPCDRAREHEW